MLRLGKAAFTWKKRKNHGRVKWQVQGLASVRGNWELAADAAVSCQGAQSNQISYESNIPYN